MRPGSVRPGVGGERDGALVVRVSARAVDGQATEAALVAGATSRTKILEVEGAEPAVLTRLLTGAAATDGT